VTGHVDGLAEVIGLCPEGDSVRVGLAVPADLGPMLAPKGSVTLDGVSLTVNQVSDEADRTHFSVNIIPHTAQQTTLQSLSIGRHVNVEIDVLARYLQRMVAARPSHQHG
jgi:riboflavin synthase